MTVPIKELTDGQLVELVRRDRKTVAYGELVKRYQSRTYGFAYSLIGDWAQAQDMTQEAFVRAYLNLEQLRDPDKFAPWLRKVAFGTCMDWRKTFRPEFYHLTDAVEDIAELQIAADEQTVSPPIKVLKQELDSEPSTPAP